ncbi:paramyosin [Trichonephila inaurata madagascariensis]|uniref:Paramyosin n=1 Tax=Trichonephila inaurata madagascariensis TaxID=2747483 RepID=A0A8X6WM82_9ARAC|nr:paramyosin [Trichonephila inaurata madagascariensis]
MCELCRVEKEKQKFQAEVYDLLAQVEGAHKDKLTLQKTVEKYEVTIHEMNIRIEELNRSVTEITAQRARLSSENSDLMKEVQEYKVTLDNTNHIKTQLASQLEDLRRKYEDEERRRSALEQTVHTLEMEVESLRVQLDEESEMKIDLREAASQGQWRATSHVQVLEKRIVQIEKINVELKTKVEEVTVILENTQRDLRNKVADLQKAQHENENLRNQIAALTRENKKLTGKSARPIFSFSCEKNFKSF